MNQISHGEAPTDLPVSRGDGMGVHPMHYFHNTRRRVRLQTTLTTLLVVRQLVMDAGTPVAASHGIPC